MILSVALLVVSLIWVLFVPTKKINHHIDPNAQLAISIVVFVLSILNLIFVFN